MPIKCIYYLWRERRCTRAASPEHPCHLPNKIIPALQTGLIFRASRLIRGRCHEASCWRSGERRLRFCLASRAPGRPGSPSGPTTGVCPSRAGRGPDERGRKPAGSGRAKLPVRPRKLRSRGGRSRRGEAPKGAPAGVISRRLGRFRDRPDREAGRGCGVPHQRRSALHLLGLSGTVNPAEAGETKTGEPRAGPTTGAAERWLRRLFEN